MLGDFLTRWRSRELSEAFRVRSSIVDGLGPLSPGMVAVLKAIITAGLYPRLGRVSYVAPVDSVANPTKCVCVARTAQGPAQLHPGSVNRFLAANGWLVYHEKVN